MPKIKEKIAYLRTTIQKLSRSRVKSADLGGSQEMPFEQAFSNLAHAYLKDKAPSLLDYEVGFQLLELNQENTKAVGIFGFKVGPQWLYAPVFFLSGDLKGHELLYIKNQDMFVPLKENWLNYILNRKPTVLGEEVPRNLRDIGVIPPHLYQLSRSPNKFAAALDNMSSWAQHVLPDIAYIATSNPATDKKYEDVTSLPDFLKKEGTAVIKTLIAGMKEMPKLATIIDQMHGLKIIEDAIGEVKRIYKEDTSNSVLRKQSARTGPKCVNTGAGVRCFSPIKKPISKSVIPTTTTSTEINSEPGDSIKTAYGDPLDPAITYALEDKLKVYVYDDVMQHGTQLEGLNAKERSKLLKDKLLIKDERPQATIAYEVDSPVRLQNPGETGLYDVLVKSNKFEKCVVILNPYSNKGREDFATIVKVDGEEKGYQWINIHPSNIWIGKQYCRDDYYKWWEKLEEPKDVGVSDTALHIIVGNTGEGTVPFMVDKELSSTDRKIYDVRFKCYAEKGRADHLPPISTRLMRYRGVYETSFPKNYFNSNQRLILTGKRGAKLKAQGEDLSVPADYRILTIRPDSEDEGSIFGMCGCNAHSDPSPLEPGNPLDIDLLLGIKTASVKIYNTGTEIEINGTRMQKLAALIHLVRDWGLREKQARIILKRSQDKKVTRFRIKRSDQSYDLQRTNIGAPGIPDQPTGYDTMTGGMVPTTHTGEWNVKVPELSAAHTDRMLYHPMGPDPDYQAKPDRQSQQHAMQAAQTGQKEIFDTAMIGSLLKAVKDDNMVNRYMGDLMKGLDRLGRILFLFYWHGEKFQDRYGKGDMIELEDGLRNAFESLGDIVLFLKQRSIEPDADHAMAPDLSEIA